jgi:ring-1,2-phenylacetyl-CoA epoxidase subunit PaaC
MSLPPLFPPFAGAVFQEDFSTPEGRLAAYALRLGDDALILGQRLSEWIGHTPVLEEDIAIANTALDLIGRARLWLELAADLAGAGRTADDLAFLRDGFAFRNLLLVELPNGDYGRTLLRAFLFDAFEVERLAALARSPEARLAEIAAKAERESRYHVERGADLIIRLGDGTEESHARLETALGELWPYVGEMFLSDPLEEGLAAAGIAPDPASLRPAWQRRVEAVLREATLPVPEMGFTHRGGRRGVHTEHLGHLLAEMQFLQRAYPGLQW